MPEGTSTEPGGGMAERCAALRAAGLPILLTPADLAELLGLTSDYYVTRNASQWPHTRVANKIRFTLEQVEGVIAAHAEAGVEEGSVEAMRRGLITRTTRPRGRAGSDA